MGLCVPVLLMPSYADMNRSDNSFTPLGDYSAIFHGWGPGHSNIYKILDSASFQHGTLNISMGFQNFTSRLVHTMAVLNIGDEVANVLLPENSRCLAVQLYHKALSSWEIPEDFTWSSMSHPCTFDLVHHNNSSIRIPKTELICHGMTLRTMYL